MKTILLMALTAGVAHAEGFNQVPVSVHSCPGLQTGKGALPDQIKKRQKLQDALCKDNGPLKSKLKTIKDKLSACNDLGKDLQGNTHSIPALTLYPQLEERVADGCRFHGWNIEKTEALCTGDGTTAEKVRLANAKNTSTPADAPLVPTMRTLQSSLNGAAADYSKFQSDAAAEKRRLDNKFANIKNGKDEDLGQNIKTMRVSIGSFVDYMEKQAKARLADRQQQARGNDEGAMRWKTQADVNRFYQNLDKCKQVIKENSGDLDRLKQDYDKTIAQSLDSAKSEAGTMASDFENKAKAQKTQADGIGETIKKIDTDKAADQGNFLNRRNLVNNAQNQADKINAGQQVPDTAEQLNTYAKAHPSDFKNYWHPGGTFTEGGVKYQTFFKNGQSIAKPIQ